MKNINIGIDLGTTNSGIGRYENGKVQVLKNPVGLRETLPSVVSYYRGRTLVGDKAREQYLSNSGNVFSAFKRKMGMADNYTVTANGQTSTVSPVDLSALVLKELKNYLHGTDIESAVITIPASFDTVQSNATKQAGYQAGFKEIVLLQEPIAACLAYANLSHLNIDDDQQWLVYDFGGGTFDAALVQVNQRELKVFDNKGNNFLGGVDIDYAFLSEIIVPKLSALTGDTDLWQKLSSKEGAYEKLWHYLSYLAEEAKKQLSVQPETYIEVDFAELDWFVEVMVTRAELNQVVQPKYQESERFVTELLEQNNLTFASISRIILVGGTTYIPFIKDALRAASGTLVDDSIDPTTAVIAGAAYYAGSQPQNLPQPEAQADNKPEAAAEIEFKLSYEAYSNDLEELIAFKTLNPFKGSYRITRADGGYDSGVVAFDTKASEFITLLPKTQNTFKIVITDEQQRVVFENAGIHISQGLYAVSGQLLPEDICLELDDKSEGTYLEVIFKRNTILPLTKTLYKTFSKSVIRNSDDRIAINVVEGKGGTLPGANLSIGYIELSGRQIDDNLIQGTDIEIQLTMDESRGLKVEIYIPTTGQQLEQSFHLAQRELNVSKILSDIDRALANAKGEIKQSDEKEAYEISARFQEVTNQLQAIRSHFADAAQNRMTEDVYRLDERKRQLLSELDNLTRARDTFMAINRYNEEKQDFLRQEAYATNSQKADFARIVAKEKEVLQSGDRHLIDRATEELERITQQLFHQNDENFIQVYLQLAAADDSMFRQGTTSREALKQAGQDALNSRNYPQLKQVVYMMYAQLHDVYKHNPEEHVQHINGINTFRTGLK